MCLWSLRDDLEQIYGDPVAIWKDWAIDVSGFGIDSGHHVAEENPVALSRAIVNFLTNRIDVLVGRRESSVAAE